MLIGRGGIGIACLCGLLGACAESGADAQEAGAQIATRVSGSEIFIVDLPMDRALVDEQALLNITNRRGYDNQPYFLPDGSALLYTSISDGKQSDIHRYDLAFSEHTRLTHTRESEYSPTIMPGGERFSSVRVEAEGAQRLWSFSMDGTSRRPILPELSKIGYHAWVEEAKLALFVVGEPNQLLIADVGTGETRIVAQDIGRSLYTIPGRNELSFVDKSNDKRWLIRAIDLDTGRQRSLIAALPGSEDFVWTPQGELLMATGKRLYMWKRGYIRWHRLVSWEEILPGDIRRIAVSSQGDRLALVVLEGDDGLS